MLLTQKMIGFKSLIVMESLLQNGVLTASSEQIVDA